MSTRELLDGWIGREAFAQGEDGSPADRDELAQVLGRLAGGIAGLSSNGPSSEAYRRFVFPYDVAAWGRIASDQLSSCALVGLAVLDCLGYEARETDAPYQPRMGRAVADFVRIGLAANARRATLGATPAWHDVTRAGCPLPEGPHIALVGNNASEGPEHVYVALSGAGLEEAFEVVEGGQLNASGGGFRIARSRYTLVRRSADQVWAGRLGAGKRRLRGFLELARLVYPATISMPG